MRGTARFCHNCGASLVARTSHGGIKWYDCPDCDGVQDL